MADDSSTVEDAASTPPVVPAQTPAQPSTQPPANNGPSNQDGPLQRLEQSIAGLPEALANVLQERAPKQSVSQRPAPKQEQRQQSSAPQGSASQSSANPETQADVPGKRKSFSDWWFGT